MRVPFISSDHAQIAKRAVEVDREQNSEFVERELIVEGDVLRVYVRVLFPSFSLIQCGRVRYNWTREAHGGQDE